MTRTARRVLVGCVLVAITSCAAPGGVPETSDTPRRDLAARPTPLAADSGAGATTKRDRPHHDAGRATATPVTTAATAGPGAATTGPVPAAAYHHMARLDDGAHDAGVNAPDYADLRAVTLADNGTSLRVTVRFDAAVPKMTASGETIGVGVDLYPPGHGRESDFQLFADGQPQGWFAYLDTPRGFVRYPGTFGLGGDRLVFTVPWSSVGKPRAGRFSAFVDWSRRTGAVTGNPSSNDFAPTIGTADYAR